MTTSNNLVDMLVCYEWCKLVKALILCQISKNRVIKSAYIDIIYRVEGLEA